MIVIAGPTAVGKTAVAVEVCRRIGGEIVSVDSRQVFRHLAIASNVAGPEELRGVPSHMTAVLEPDQRIDAARFTAMARPVLDEIRSRGAVPVLTAGTGLYLRALLEGLDLGGHPADPALRRELETEAALDLDALFHRLAELDPAVAADTDRRNPVRIVRRLELAILRARGRGATLGPSEAIPAEVIGLDCDRSELHARIRTRVDRMIEAGLADEVATLLQNHRPSPQVIGGIGVREMAEHLEMGIPMDGVKARIAQRTRAYARRQLTWFRSDPGTRWVVAGGRPLSDIVESVMQGIQP